MKIRSFLPQFVLVSLLLSIPFLFASSTGRIEGKVVDIATGDPILGVSIRIEGTAMGGKTAFDGRYVIISVPPGKYDLIATAEGYEKEKITDVEVTADASTKINIQMKQVAIDLSPITLPEEKRKDLIFKDGRAAALEMFNCTGTYSKAEAPYTNYYPPAHGGTAIVNGEAFDAMFFKNYGVNPFVFTEDDHFSTFATDVDDASYIMTRSYLERGELPPNEAVRVEEFVNHFDYGYDPPYHETFTVYMEGSPSRFGQNCSLLRIGIKGKEVAPEQRKPANLVFVIDISGSMAREDRLGLVKKALRELVNELKEKDRVGIIVYGSQAREILQPTSIKDRYRILDAIEQLCTGGSTNAEHGLHLGYQMADHCFEKGKINRIILCSDGVANVGTTKAEDLLDYIKKYADKGITLSTIGFGMGNYNDILMEKLGNKGNGHYAYVDDIAEARRIFVDNLTGNLQVIARDVKIQVDFDPEKVLSYRLLGFENRDVDDDKFRVDTVDGGEIGAGHSVTALYEIKFHKDTKSGQLGTVYIRYKDPTDFEVTEINKKIEQSAFTNRFEACSPQFRLAAVAAEFSEILRDSYWAKGASLKDVLAEAKKIEKEISSSDLIELLHLISKGEQLRADHAEK